MSEEDIPLAYEWYEKATLAFQKLSPKKGDFIYITVPSRTDPRQIEIVAALLQEAIIDHLPEGVHAMVVSSGIEIAKLDKAQMAKCGWYKLGNQ